MKHAIVHVLILCMLAINASSCMEEQAHSNDQEKKQQLSISWQQWKAACLDLPVYIPNAFAPVHTPLTWETFKHELELSIKDGKDQLQKGNWIGSKPNLNNLKDISPFDFLPFVQKAQVEQKTLVAIKGDLHGDIHSLIHYLMHWIEQGYLEKDNGFKIKNKNVIFLFLGDYVDRGWWGAEVLYTLFRLRRENRDNVYMVRGNHEEIGMNESFGFGDELRRKFKGQKFIELCTVYNFYYVLPLAIYLGVKSQNRKNEHDNNNKKTTEFVQCCHGGIEIAYDPKNLLLHSQSNCYECIQKLPEKPITMFEKIFAEKNYKDQMEFKAILEEFYNYQLLEEHNGFMWSDFNVDPNLPFAAKGTKADRLMYGMQPTEDILDFFNKPGLFAIVCFFRGHQHVVHNPNNPENDSEMNQRILNIDKLSHPDDTGVGKLWFDANSVHNKQPGLLNGIRVVTFAVSANLEYNYPKDYFGLLTLAEHFKDWNLRVHALEKVKLPLLLQPQNSVQN